MDAGRAEAAERDLDRVIERRATGLRDPEELHPLWQASQRAHRERLRRENRAAWYAHHERMRELHEGLARSHAERADALCLEPAPGRPGEEGS